MKISRNNYLYTIIITIVTLFATASCGECSNSNLNSNSNVGNKPGCQLDLEGIDASASLEGDETYSFFIVNRDSHNTVSTDEILLSLESEIEFTLNNCSADRQGLTLKRILEVDKVDKIEAGARQEVALKLKNAKGSSATTTIKLQLKDKVGNKIGEEKSLVWKPKAEILLNLSITNVNLKGNDEENRKIEFKVASLDTILHDKDAISLDLTPDNGTTAAIVGASQATLNGKITYTYQVKKEDINKIIKALSIDSQGSTQASFKVQLMYHRQQMGKQLSINWEAATTTSKTIEVTQQMLNEIYSKPGCIRLYDVLQAIKDGKVGQELDINKIDSRHKLGYTALLEAINIGREDIVALLLAKGADVNVLSTHGETPIEVAIRSLNVGIVHLLLEQKNLGSNITYGKDRKSTKLLLNLAIESKNVGGDIEEVTKIADMLLDKLDIDTIIRINGSGQESPILLAIQYRRTQLVKKLLAKGFIPDLKNKQGETAIHLVARYNQKELAEQLIAEDIHLDVQNNVGDTPLHIAVALPKNKEIAKLLINKFKEKGISLDLANQHGQSPLHKIAGTPNGENMEIMKNLLQAGARPNVQDGNGRTPLHYAISSKYRNIIEELIKGDVQMDIQDNQGDTPLHLLVANNYVDIVRSVIAKNPNLKNIKNKADKLPKDLATTLEMKALFN